LRGAAATLARPDPKLTGEGEGGWASTMMSAITSWNFFRMRISAHHIHLLLSAQSIVPRSLPRLVAHGTGKILVLLDTEHHGRFALSQ